jgi:hypothetical protein
MNEGVRGRLRRPKPLFEWLMLGFSMVTVAAIAVSH